MRLFLPILLFVSFSCSQTKKDSVVAATENHQRIPGSNVHVVLPPDFYFDKIWPHYDGADWAPVIDGKGSSIRFSNVSLNFFELMSSFRQSDQFAVLELKETSFNEYPAVEIRANNLSFDGEIALKDGFEVEHRLLYFGDSSFCVRGKVTYPVNASEHHKKVMREALFSAVLKNEDDSYEFELLPFSIERIKEESFTPSTIGPYIIAYRKTNTEGHTDRGVWFSMSYHLESESMLERIPTTIPEDTITIDGILAFSRQKLDSHNKGDTVLSFSWDVELAEQESLSFYAQADKNFEENLEAFQRISRKINLEKLRKLKQDFAAKN